MLYRILGRIVSALFILLVSACAILTPEPGELYSKSGRNHLYSLDEWHMNGRINITGQKDSWTANIEWHHLPDSDHIKLSGPLGQGATLIELAGGEVTIDRGGGKVLSSNQPEQFISQQIGISVPLRSLRFWAIGLPEEEQDFQPTADGFVQAGWLVAYKEMQKLGKETLPHKLTVTKPQVKLKLVVNQWVLDGNGFN
jgi:outer membrane lipoprotein LolB